LFRCNKVSIESADLEAVIILDTPPVVRIRRDEEWARRCISAALGGVDVVHHDDGSEPGMHDLEISYVNHPPGAACAISLLHQLPQLIDSLRNLIDEPLEVGSRLALRPTIEVNWPRRGERLVPM
jgi:hypothetical protein